MFILVLCLLAIILVYIVRDGISIDRFIEVIIALMVMLLSIIAIAASVKAIMELP